MTILPTQVSLKTYVHANARLNLRLLLHNMMTHILVKRQALDSMAHSSIQPCIDNP